MAACKTELSLLESHLSTRVDSAAAAVRDANDKEQRAQSELSQIKDVSAQFCYFLSRGLFDKDPTVAVIVV